MFFVSRSRVRELPYCSSRPPSSSPSRWPSHCPSRCCSCCRTRSPRHCHQPKRRRSCLGPSATFRPCRCQELQRVPLGATMFISIYIRCFMSVCFYVFGFQGLTLFCVMSFLILSVCCSGCLKLLYVMCLFYVRLLFWLHPLRVPACASSETCRGCFS